MFVAWRDLRFARGRFALVAVVVVLMTLLVGLLSGLTAGLARQSTSAITGLPADHLVFGAAGGDADPSFTRSTVRPEQWRRFADAPGVRAADPVGIATVPGSGVSGGSPGAAAAVAAFGVPTNAGLAPAAVGDGEVTLSAGAADALATEAGDVVTLAGQRLRVGGVAGDAWFNHTPVVWTSLSDWQRLSPGSSGGATVIALSTDGTADLAGVDERLGTSTVATGDALSAIGSYTAENGSLQLMRGFLFVISALVIGAFFTVWTVQRGRDVAILKALGATTGYLLRDALGQAAVVLVGATAVGAGLAAGIGAVASGVVPFVLSAGTVAVPALVTIGLGMFGAALAVRRITSVDPLVALSGH